MSISFTDAGLFYTGNSMSTRFMGTACKSQLRGSIAQGLRMSASKSERLHHIDTFGAPCLGSLPLGQFKMSIVIMYQDERGCVELDWAGCVRENCHGLSIIEIEEWKLPVAPPRDLAKSISLKPLET